MSKVIKNSGDFVPQRIVDKSQSQPTVWGEIVTEILPDSNEVTADQQVKSGVEVQHDMAETTSPVSDFSEPDPDGTHAPQADHHQGEQNAIQQGYSQQELDSSCDDSFQQGVTEGLEQAKSDYGLSINALQSICDQLSSIRDTILKNSMDEMKELVLIISEKIIRNSLASQKETIFRTVEEAITKAVKSDEFIISVNADDYEVINEKSGNFIRSVSGLENIIVRVDDTIERGGCLIESSNCTVDATVASQLDLIGTALKDAGSDE